MNWGETTPRSLPPTMLSKWGHVVAAATVCICFFFLFFFSGDFAHCSRKSVGLCLARSAGRSVAGSDPGYSFACLRSAWQSQGTPEAWEGCYGPTEPANRKLILTLAHLPNIHCLEMSKSMISFFHGNVFLFVFFFHC